MRHRAVVTRRRFLEQLGLAGGSSLVMTAMSSWDLMAGQAGARPALSGRPNRSKVVVLGAGVSGLVVGYELGRLGYDYRILEARERVGGLAWTIRRGTQHTEINGERQTCTFDEGLYVNVGAWRIPYTHTGVLNYCKELNVPVEIFLNEADGAYFFYEGSGAGPLSNRRVRLREVKADMVGYTNELIVKAIDQKQLDLPLVEEDKQRFLDYLIAQGYLDSSDHRYKAFATRGPGDPYEFAALLRSGFGGRVRSVAATSGTRAGLMFQPVGGMDQIPKGFQRAVGSRLTLNAEVQSVHQDDTRVKVVYADTRNGRKTEVDADFVVVCIPLSVLAGVDINLSPDMMTAVKATSYSNSAKVGLAMRRRFWEEDDQIFGGHLYSNLPLGEFSYPSNDFFSKKGVLLGLYANGPVGDLLDRPVKDRIDHVVMHASKVHPQIRDEFESAYAVWWRKVKYNLGGYASGSAQARRGQLAKLENRVVIGSAATAPYSSPDWLEGAVASAWQALKVVHERAMRA
jgi:monoamine oxidase